jgi:hypothetical protein
VIARVLVVVYNFLVAAMPRWGARKNNFYKLILASLPEVAITVVCRMLKSSHGFGGSINCSFLKWTSDCVDNGRRRRLANLAGVVCHL